MDLQELAERLTTGCRILAEQEIVDAYGHLSARVPGEDGHFMINRGMSPALVTPADFIVLDFAGQVVQGSGHPNVEWPIHAGIYRVRPDVGSVSHSHSTLSRIFSLSSRKLRGLLTSSTLEWHDGVPVYRKAGLITTSERGGEVARLLGPNSAILLRGHGDVVAGRDVTNTVMMAVTLKLNAEVLHGVISHGGDIELWTEEEIDEWGRRRDEGVSQAALDALSGRAWDYYEARVDGRLARLLHPERSSEA